MPSSGDVAISAPKNHRYVKNALLPADWGGDLAEIEGRFGE
jgi:hypothetical protein